MIKKRFNPIKDKSSEIIEFLMSSPDIPDDDTLQFKLRLSIEEAVDNVVRYAYDGGIGWLEAGIRIEGSDPILTIELRDAGKKFNPLERKDPDISLNAEDRQIGGLGIFLCKILKILSIPIIVYLFKKFDRSCAIYFWLNLGISRTEYYVIPIVIEYVFFRLLIFVAPPLFTLLQLN